MNSAKKLLVRLFVSGRVLRRVSAVIAAVVASYAVGFLPGAPEVVGVVIAALLDLPEGAELTQAGLTAVLSPIVLAFINDAVQAYITRESNKTLLTLTATGEYDGKIDGVVGSVARTAIRKLDANATKSDL